MDEHHRQRQSLEVVWTGPTPHGTTLRRTDQALLDLIHGARESLVIVFYTAYRIPAVRKALLAAMDRGVRLTLIAEPDADHDGKVSFDPIAALGTDLARRASVLTWPPEKRPRDAQGRYGSLHVKCAIADRSVLLVSSANVTEFALALNMELGLLVRGGDAPEAVARHLEALRTSGVLRPT
jgi:phosphatidylserine/phosphatidylglycerophosphate/cardiolipin synthase-like enzyme